MTGEMVRKRRREHEERPEAVNQFGQCMQLAQKAVDSYKVRQGINWVHVFFVFRCDGTLAMQNSPSSSLPR